jgi:transposase
VELTEFAIASQQLTQRWQQQLRRYGEKAFPGNGKAHTEEAKIAALERRVGQLTMENDLLKKVLHQLNSNRK